MAFYDWNHNGKKDLQDDFLEYKIYEECQKDSNQPPRGDSGGGGCSCFLYGLVILFVIKLFIELFS